MKHILTISLVLIAVTASLWFGMQWVGNGGWPASGASGETLPAHIEYVNPADGQAVEDPYAVCAHFNYLAGRGLGEQPEQSIRLYLDGVNVTRDLVDLVRLEYGYPYPLGEPCYTRHEPLPPGWHTAKVTYVDIAGEHFAYKWRFEVFTEE